MIDPFEQCRRRMIEAELKRIDDEIIAVAIRAADRRAIEVGGRLTATEICLRARQFGQSMTDGLTIEKLIRAKAIMDAADVPSEGRMIPLPIPAIWIGQPPRRRNRHARKPLAQWRERMARLEHKAQLRRWRANPVVRSQWAAMRKALEAGEVVQFMGFKLIDARPIPTE